MPIAFPDLPYAPDALEPYMSRTTLLVHHGKHHRGYATKAAQLIEGTALAKKSLEDIVCETARDPSRTTIFNNAAQAWNHAFFWSCMKPRGGERPTGELARMAVDAFGSLDGFKKAFADAAEAHFGSGWAWIVLKDGKLEIKCTSNAETPIASGERPLLTCDLWEHAYYLDYRHQRAKFVDAFLNNLVNWEFVAGRLAAAEADAASNAA